MHGLNKQGKRFYYVCDDARHVSTKRLCNSKMIRAEVIEWQVWEGLNQRAQDIAKLEHDLRIAQQEELDEREPRRAELEALEVNMAQTEKQAAELARAFARTDPDGIVGKSLEQQIESVNALHHVQVKRRAELQAELGARRLTDQAIGDILTFARDVREGIDNANFDDKRRILRTLSVKVTVKEGHFHLESLLGEWDGEILSLPSYRNLPSRVDEGLPSGFCPCHLSAARHGTRLTWAP